MSRNGSAQLTRAGRLLDVERFERVVAPGATALLRLTGRLLSRGGVDVDAPVLVVDGEHRFAPLPGPAPTIADGRLAVAFPVPAALRGTAFTLELGDGVVALDPPAERSLRAAGASAVRDLELELRRARERAR